MGGSDTVFPADPNADRYLMWDDDPGALVWQTVAGGGDMLKATYDADNDGKVDAIEETILIGVNEVYAVGWNADTGLPEKDDVYDYLHLIDTNDDGDVDTIDATLWATKQAAMGADDNYVTDAEKTVIGNTSNTNTGDQTAIPNSALANMTQKTYKGRTTASTGVPEDVAVATLKTDLGLVKGDVGLGNVDNTTDAGKPVSTATQTALDLKAPLISPSFTTPTLGVATATSINKVAITAPATASTLTIVDGATLTASATASVEGTNTGDQTLPTDATIVTTDVTTNNASISKHGW